MTNTPGKTGNVVRKNIVIAMLCIVAAAILGWFTIHMINTGPNDVRTWFPVLFCGTAAIAFLGGAFFLFTDIHQKL